MTTDELIELERNRHGEFAYGSQHRFRTNIDALAPSLLALAKAVEETPLTMHERNLKLIDARNAYRAALAQMEK